MSVSAVAPSLAHVVRVVAMGRAWFQGVHHSGFALPDGDIDSDRITPVTWVSQIERTTTAPTFDTVNLQMGIADRETVLQPYIIRTTIGTYSDPKILVTHQLEMEPVNVRRADGSMRIDTGPATYRLQLSLGGPFLSDHYTAWMKYQVVLQLNLLCEFLV